MLSAILNACSKYFLHVDSFLHSSISIKDFRPVFIFSNKYWNFQIQMSMFVLVRLKVLGVIVKKIIIKLDKCLLAQRMLMKTEKLYSKSTFNLLAMTWLTFDIESLFRTYANAVINNANIKCFVLKFYQVSVILANCNSVLIILSCLMFY